MKIYIRYSSRKTNKYTAATIQITNQIKENLKRKLGVMWSVTVTTGDQ